jgi:hypothetical protein
MFPEPVTTAEIHQTMPLPQADQNDFWWQKIWAYLRPPPIITVDSFKIFLSQRAALIAQKCAIDYCRGKTGLMSFALFEEETFLKALAICRWEAYAAVLADLLIVAEAYLRPHTSPTAYIRLREALRRLYPAILRTQGLPEHRPEGWDDVVKDFDERLTAAGVNAPSPVVDIADHSAKRLFNTLPIHASMRELDEEVVFGAVRFRMVAVAQEMRRRIDAAAVVAALLADGVS